MSLDETLKRKIESSSSLASLPTIALQVLDVAEDPDTGLVDVENIVQNDPALSARLIRVANSPLFSRGHPIDSTLQALTLLGLDSALSLTLSFSLMGSLRQGEVGGDSVVYWRRSVISALCARELATKIGLTNAGSVFLAALLQDLGILVLKKLEGDSYQKVVAKHTIHSELIEHEVEMFGGNHSEVGAILAEAWRLPSLLVQAISSSHSLVAHADNPEQRFLGCVALSGPMADAIINNDGPQDCDFASHAAALKLSQNDLDAIVKIVLEEIPDLSSLFEIQLIDESELAVIQEKSKEILMMRMVHSQIAAKEQAEQTADIERRSKNLEELARRDGLTGIYNRNHLDDMLQWEFESCSKNETPISVAFLDLDHFKLVNDTHGHQVGDVVLRQIAHCIESSKRIRDSVGRYGGEEFVLIMPGTNSSDALAAVERLQEKIREQRIPLADGETLGVTASIGLATNDEGAGFNKVEQLVNAADIAVYEAKQAGRNRVVTYTEKNSS